MAMLTTRPLSFGASTRLGTGGETGTRRCSSRRTRSRCIADSLDETRIAGAWWAYRPRFFKLPSAKRHATSRFCPRKIYIESMLRPEPARLAGFAGYNVTVGHHRANFQRVLESFAASLGSWTPRPCWSRISPAALGGSGNAGGVLGRSVDPRFGLPRVVEKQFRKKVLARQVIFGKFT